LVVATVMVAAPVMALNDARRANPNLDDYVVSTVSLGFVLPPGHCAQRPCHKAEVTLTTS
jgi:hypothetical protein